MIVKSEVLLTALFLYRDTKTTTIIPREGVNNLWEYLVNVGCCRYIFTRARHRLFNHFSLVSKWTHLHISHT